MSFYRPKAHSDLVCIFDMKTFFFCRVVVLVGGLFKYYVWCSRFLYADFYKKQFVCSYHCSSKLG